MHDDTPEDDVLDWSAPVETLARPVKATPDRSTPPLMVAAVVLGLMLSGWLWTLRPSPAAASAAPEVKSPATFEPHRTPSPQRVELFELPAWDDSKS
ncbi:MAG TPA: hypothetical protein VGB55_02960 [Tepidisphaeraceae bacterium]|jgi:hypothetical protein